MREPHYTFTALRVADLPLVRAWLLQPHVKRWWDDGVQLPYPDAVIESYRSAIRGEDPSYHYIAYIDGRRVGMFQHYRVADHPEYAEALALDEDAIGVDLFIGEPDLIGKGHGPQMLREFLRLAFTHPWDNAISVCVIGPSLTNVSAIRAYEKAGFKFLRDVKVPGEPDPEHLMRLTRADLGPIAAAPLQ